MIETFEIVAKAVADRSRVRILKLLEGGELCVCHLTSVLGLAPATVSKHLSLLTAAGLVQRRRAGKWVYTRRAERDLNPYARPFLALIGDHLKDDPMIEQDRRQLASSAVRCDAAPVNVLVVCTGNSARSVMAECLINAHGGGHWKAYSAGSHPAGAVNPLTLAVLAEHGHSTQGLRSKSWDEFAAPGAPQMDLVITVCDNAAGEVCPVWPGHPSKIHLGFPDPAAVQGSQEERLAAFRDVFAEIEAEIHRLVEMDIDHVRDLRR